MGHAGIGGGWIETGLIGLAGLRGGGEGVDFQDGGFDSAEGELVHGLDPEES